MNLRTQHVEINSDTPITVNELFTVLTKLIENNYGNFLIEIGLDNLFLHKVSYTVFDKTINLN